MLFFTALDFTFTTRHIHNWASFLLWPNHYILSGAISNCPGYFPEAYWIPSDLGAHLLVSSFCLFTLSMGFLQQEYWGGLPFPPPVDHYWSELSTMTHLSWVALHGIAHNFIELYKPLCHGRGMWSMWSMKGNGILPRHKKEWILLFVSRWLHLEGTMLNEINHTKKEKHHTVYLFIKYKKQ